MFFLRPICFHDLEAFVKLANESHLGLTTLPKDRAVLEQKLYHSVDSFQKDVHSPSNELYLFVLEDTEKHTIAGVSGIASTTGGNEPLHFYRKEILHVDSAISHVVQNIPILNPISYARGPSEMCSLYLLPSYRKHNLGKLLSFGRFLFMAKFPDRFTNSVFAELRGVINPDNKSPFWEGVGKYFFNMPLADALEMLRYGRNFISHFLPKYPIYIPLLPKEVQNVIGKAHPNTQAALVMLLEQGFEITDEIDVFDAGPKIRALRENIKAIKTSDVRLVAEIRDDLAHPQQYLVANEKCQNFRACFGALEKKGSDLVSISSELAESLEIGLGDQIRSFELPLKPEKAS